MLHTEPIINMLQNETEQLTINSNTTFTKTIYFTWAISLAPASVNVLSFRLRTLSFVFTAMASTNAEIPGGLIPFWGIANSSKVPIAWRRCRNNTSNLAINQIKYLNLHPVYQLCNLQYSSQSCPFGWLESG